MLVGAHNTEEIKMQQTQTCCISKGHDLQVHLENKYNILINVRSVFYWTQAEMVNMAPIQEGGNYHFQYKTKNDLKI